MMARSSPPVVLTAEHIAAVNRPRRIVVNHPADGVQYAVKNGICIQDLIKYELAFATDPNSQIDAEWWCLDETFPMKSRPMTTKASAVASSRHLGGQVGTFRRWADAGTNLARVYQQATKECGLECFYSYRISTEPANENPPLARSQPNWLMESEWGTALWNFAEPGVREWKQDVLRELAEDYDFDGLELDFSRNAMLFPPGHQWTNRGLVNDFMREIRSTTLAIEQRRGRPFLLAARVPDCITGCHFDGLEVEAWVNDNLIDMLVLGVRSFELDVEWFRNLIGSRPIKLLATLDDHHATDGYSWPGIEVFRGVVANWWQQGIDAIQTFNWGTAPPELATQLGFAVTQAYFDGTATIPVYQQGYRELGSAQTLACKDKVFVVQRRGSGGSGGAPVEDWSTPRFTYQNTNMLGQLPATLDDAGKVDTLLVLRVADDVAHQPHQLRRLSLRLLLSDPATAGLDANCTVDRAIVRSFWGEPQLFTSPPLRDIVRHVQVRLNGALLAQPVVENGWLVFAPDANLFAVGKNLLAVRVTNRPPSASSSMLVEKLEVHVHYHRPSEGSSTDMHDDSSDEARGAPTSRTNC